MGYKDMFTVLVVDSRIERSQSLRDSFDRILGHLRDDHHLRTDVLGTTRDAIIHYATTLPWPAFCWSGAGRQAASTGSVSWKRGGCRP